jgi:hypothetical protein
MTQLVKGAYKKRNQPHISLSDCETVAYLRFRHLGHFSVESSDFYDAPIIKVLHFIRSAGLIKG